MTHWHPWSITTILPYYLTSVTTIATNYYTQEIQPIQVCPLVIQLSEHSHSSLHPVRLRFVRWHVNEAHEVTGMSSCCKYTPMNRNRKWGTTSSNRFMHYKENAHLPSVRGFIDRAFVVSVFRNILSAIWHEVHRGCEWEQYFRQRLSQFTFFFAPPGSF